METVCEICLLLHITKIHSEWLCLIVFCILFLFCCGECLGGGSSWNQSILHSAGHTDAFCKWIYERSYFWTAEKDMKTWFIQLYTQLTCSCEIKAWKKFRLKRTHDLYDTSSVLYQLSCLANCELAKLWVWNIHVDDKGCKWIYEKSYIWTTFHALIVQVLKFCEQL